MNNPDELKEKLRHAINYCSAEGLVGDMPDFLAAELLFDVLAAVGKAVKARDEWYGVQLRPGAKQRLVGREPFSLDAQLLADERRRNADLREIGHELRGQLARLHEDFLPSHPECGRTRDILARARGLFGPLLPDSGGHAK